MDYAPPERNGSAAHHASEHATLDSLSRMAEPPPVTTVEWDHLRFRVVALENLLIALMADGPLPRLDRLREMARHVAPRRGSAEHPVSQFAAVQIIHMVERARHVKKHPPA